MTVGPLGGQVNCSEATSCRSRTRFLQPGNYEREWQAPLSRDLGVTDRTVRNWAGGLNRPADIADRIVPLLRTRAEQLAHIIALAERHQNR